MTIERADRRSPGRHERGGGARAARRGRAGRTSTSSRRCSTPPSAPWSWRRELDASGRAALPRERGAPRGRRPRSASSSGAAGAETALDVATGGGHVARRLREAGRRRRHRGFRRRACSPTWSRGPRTSRSPTGASTSSSCRVAAHHFDDVPRRCREMARVSRDRRARRRQPLPRATRRGGGAPARSRRTSRNYTEGEWRSFFEAGRAARSSEVESVRQADRARALARARPACDGRGGASGSASSARATGIDGRLDHLARPKLVLRGRGSPEWRSSSTATRGSSSRA